MPTSPRSSHRRSRRSLNLPALLAKPKASGLSAAAFARQRDVPVWKLYRARLAAQRRHSRRSATLVPLRVVAAAPATAAPLELQLPSGLRLLVPADFDETGLRRLLGVVASC